MDATTNSKIRQLCSQGEKLHKLGDYDRAVSKFYEALTLLPKNERSQIATFLYVSIGEAYWCMEDYENAGESFCQAYECPGMSENAQITMRIGQFLAECEDMDNARDYLRHAVRLGGEELLLAEDHKYYEILHPAAKKAAPATKPEPEPEQTENLAQSASGGFAVFDGYKQFDSDFENASAPEEEKPVTEDKPVVQAAEKPHENRFAVAAAALADDIREESAQTTSSDHNEPSGIFGDMFNPKPHSCVTAQDAAAESSAAEDTAAETTAATAETKADSEKKQGFFQRFFKKK